ncbi:MAG: inositol monophosphatase [Parcubacteria group bacterium Gr01-1014_56]|nr:MAG: inositol monophosphatase [Parcubacteria group bacterium Gr01-1014_56]
MEILSPLAHFLVALSEEASTIMLKYFSPLGVPAEKKADMSPVTKADTEINQMVIDRVKKSYPDYEVLGEEQSTDITKSNKLFVVDPVDGTHMFAIGAPMFCFSAAVVVDGVSVAGVLSNPLVKRTLVAEQGRGAYLVETNSKIKVSEKDTLDRAVINAGWSDARGVENLHTLGARTPEVYSICEAGSLVALGGFDGGIFTGSNAHDIAAIKIVVEEAGGTVTDINGNEQRYDREIKGALISNGMLHGRLVKIVKESGLSNDFNGG